jgi:hypothetical protein
MENKHLIIFFGQYRNFNHIVPQLNLDGFDVIASTWDMAFSANKVGVTTNNWRTPITEDDILKYIPNAKVIISNHLLGDKLFGFRNPAKMLYHIKNAINSIPSDKIYDTISLHRFDLFSNIHEIQNMKLEEDVFYGDSTKVGEGGLQDWLFFGKDEIIKKYINLFDYDDIVDEEAHQIHSRHLTNYNIKQKPISNTIIEYTLLKDLSGEGYSNFLKSYNLNGIKYFDLDKDSDLAKIFKQNIIWK